MKTKGLLMVLFLTFSFCALQAQESKAGKTGSNVTGMGTSDKVEPCMDKIAADKNLRMQMMTRMMDNMKNDTASMKEMFGTMMKDPKMHSMMMKMVKQGMGSGMGNEMDKMMNHDEMNEKSDTSNMIDHQQ